MEQSPKKNSAHSEQLLHRIQFLTDGIFVLAMTLMILQFDTPELNQQMTNLEIQNFLFAQFPALGIYFISFLLVAFYWVAHLERFQHYQRTDQPHIWLQLLSLMFLVILPYSNDLSTLYTLNFPVQVFSSLNLFFVGIFSYCSWAYATHNHRLVAEDLDPGFINSLKKKTLVEPLVSLLAIIPASINPSFWGLTFLLIPLVYIYLEKSNSQK
ncbi:MAG: DUF1211 domain-containing protein [Symploca sp. SIO1B1]|nr:DUF1211 domain-containing protein [Symploca sp. SIO1C2]NER99497.1 DUF1211 domain-containing protein [Symploca sp. SIO1B1]